MDQMAVVATFHSNSLNQFHGRFGIGGRVLKDLAEFVYQSLHPFVRIIGSLGGVASPADRLQGLEPRIKALDLLQCFLLLPSLDVKHDSGKAGIEKFFEQGERYFLIAEGIFDFYR